MRWGDIILGIGLVLLGGLALSGLDHGHSVLSQAIHASLAFRVLSNAALVVGLSQSGSALFRFSFGRRLCAILAIGCWIGVVMTISSIVKAPTDGALACLTLACLNLQTSLGLRSDA